MHSSNRCLVVRAWAALGLVACFSTEGGQADLVKQGSDEYEFVYRVKLPEIRSPGRLWLPLATSGPFQEVRITGMQAPRGSRQIKDRDQGNTILVWDLSPSNRLQLIEITYQVRRREVAAYPATPEESRRYLEPQRLVPADHTFRTIATEAVGGEIDALARGRALYQHVLARMKYDKSGSGWGRGDALYACEARAGNCTDFHAYFIALARALGVPARFAIGYTIPADRDQGIIEGYHCWAEFLADGRWVPVDISEAWKHPELAEYFFGHRPANRLELSVERDLVVDPLPASGPINFLVYPLLEIGGQAVATENEFSFRRPGKPG